MKSLMHFQNYQHQDAYAIHRKRFLRLKANLIDDENLTIDSEHILAENPTLNPSPPCQVLILYFLNGYASSVPLVQYCLLLHHLPNHQKDF
jgi:hypothetical protein